MFNMNNNEFDEVVSSLVRKGCIKVFYVDGEENYELTEKGLAACTRGKHEQ